MTPTKEELETKARHFANTVFVVGAGIVMLVASLLQPFAVQTMGTNGGDVTFILATICIFVLASKRSRFALFAIERQCAKYGHTLLEGSSTCSRCFQTIPDENQPD